MGKMPIPPTFLLFYSFTFLLFYFFTLLLFYFYFYQYLLR